MSVGKSNIIPSRIDPFESHAKDAYDDAEWGKENGSYLYEETDIKIYEGENHYMKFDFNYSGKANVYLEWDDDTDLDLYVFDRDGLRIAKDSSSNDKVNEYDNKYVLIHSIDINKYDNYIVGIRAYDVDGSFTRYKLKVKIYKDHLSYDDMLTETGLDEEVDYIHGDYEFMEWGDRTLKLDRMGTDVSHLQRILYKLGFINDKDEIDGKFGSYTRNAVEDFQYASGIDDDGIVGSETREYLSQTLSNRRDSLEIAENLSKNIISQWCDIRIPSGAFLDELYYTDTVDLNRYMQLTYKAGINIDDHFSLGSQDILSFNYTNGTFDGISLGGRTVNISEIPIIGDDVERLVSDCMNYDIMSTFTMSYGRIDVNSEGIELVGVEFQDKDNSDNYFTRATLTLRLTWDEIKEFAKKAAICIVIIAVLVAIILGGVQLATLAAAGTAIGTALAN